MNELDLLQHLNQNYLMLVPALWVLGFALKQTPRIPNWSIIWIIGAVSLALAFVSYGFHIEAFVNGITAAGISVFGHQLVKNSMFSRSDGS